MTFDEWWEEHKYDYGKNSIKVYSRDAWNAAVDEAVKVAKETDCMGCESFLADQVKKLKNME